MRLRQTKILLRKNLILIKRSYRATFIQLIVPFLFVFFLWILQFGIKANEKNSDALKVYDNPIPDQIGNIPRCIIGPDLDYCYTVAYTTNTPVGEFVINEIKRKQNIPDDEIRVFATSDDMDVFIDENHNSTTAAISFNLTSTNQLHYSVMYNKSTVYNEAKEILTQTYIQLPWIHAIEFELTKNITNNNNLKFNVDFIEYAHPELVIRDVIGDMGPVFFFAALMFNVVIQLGQIVREKELKLREGMKMMGLHDSVYWFTWTLTNIATNIVSACILTASGYIFQFDFFKRNEFPTFFFVFILFGISMVPFVFFLSTIIKRSEIATSIGFVIFLAGIVIQGFAPTAFQENFYAAVRVILSLLPFALLSKGIGDLSAASAGSQANGLKWSERFDNEFFSLQDVYSWFIFDFFFYFLIALYLDNVLKGLYGVAKGPFFFLQPSYWSSKPQKPKLESASKSKKRAKKGIELDEAEDEDVVTERENIINGNLSEHDSAVKITNLRKVYKKSTCCGKTKEFAAVKGTYLSIAQGQLFVLLGHNGAGKTTTFNMMTGLFGPSSGDATVFGHSIVTGMDEIRKTMGVCPQHDILWNELTGREHLEIFASFKGIPDTEIPKEVEERLKDVELTNVANLPTGKYSGGMRRRLSTAISLIGNPKIVFLDECTTGMDVCSRRQVWNLIERVKRGRIIILTTHSMEEADILGDKIGIMSKGKLVCVGTSLRLKSKFGAGYKLVALYDATVDDAATKIANFFEVQLSVKPSLMQVGSLEFNVPRSQLNNLMEFFDKVEAAKAVLPLTDIQIRMSTLEEVFLTIAGHDE
ncbi:hypothetical protein DFA_08664 [Cavenderia fasciculata]|uniref:ABC transporter domain-containing protein n=1 Tax=Cavenderia fasciculata TaxID=261658 RepID=F4Q3L0_CACFS|nr:uncharacterized protein DFA_08664 [Cavenderia fasciculata]EGG17668.1 hypothetical protein DFA_08664 [Cavenderia fasciculata]|eukprot:XP_004356152.1 hypothetical protein DFA_08664 [Cavenderia fasciculata]